MPLRAPGGVSAVEYITKIASAAAVTEGDLMYALGRQLLRIQERTVQGMDYRGQAFAPYSTRGPYYHSPSKESRFAGYRTHRQKQAIALHHARFYGGTRRRGGTAVKYQSYADFKAARGVSAPDLGGMEGSLLPALRVNLAGEHTAESAMGIALEGYPGPAGRGAIGIYEQPAARIASGHQHGQPGRLPQRAFVGVSDEDMKLIQQDIAERIRQRMGKGV